MAVAVAALALAAGGLTHLASAVIAGTARRRREVALLKTLGMTRLGVATVFAVEYALIGLVAGGIGAGGAGLLAWSVLTRRMELEWSFHLPPYAIALAAAVTLTVVAGLAASIRALAQKPIDVLRSE